MKLLCLTLTLVFSSFILVNVIPVYADGTTMYYKEHAYDGFHSSIASQGTVNSDNVRFTSGNAGKGELAMFIPVSISAIDGHDLSFRLDEGAVNNGNCGDIRYEIWDGGDEYVDDLDNQNNFPDNASFIPEGAGILYTGSTTSSSPQTYTHSSVDLSSAGSQVTIAIIIADECNGGGGNWMSGNFYWIEIDDGNIAKWDFGTGMTNTLIGGSVENQYGTWDNIPFTSSVELFVTVDTTPPIITLTGDNPQSIELGDGYTELGATTDDDSTVTIDSLAFSDSLGSYSVTYNSVDSSGNDAIQVTRTVTVVDTTPPTITAPSNITAEATGTSTSVTIISATATDESSFTITNNTPTLFSLGVTIITWTATDESGNQSTITSTVTISDPRKPTQGETPLNELDKWIINHGGIYFGMGIFTFGFIIIGVMASPKTVPIFTIILVILAGLLHATGIFILPAWFWGIAIIMTITLVLKRKK